jgi:Leucine-rich repeat (LRR) protein
MIETSKDYYGTIGLTMNDLILNWKKTQQVLSRNHLNIYTLLDLSMNQLSGEIPASLGSLNALKALNISHNNLDGRVPASLGDLENLESLDLSFNNISGSIPQSLAKLQQLTILDVSNNKLTGKIPVGSQMDTMNDPNFYANNSGLCGMQIRVPCLEDLSPTIPPKVESKETWFLVGRSVDWICSWLLCNSGKPISYWVLDPYKTSKSPWSTKKAKGINSKYLTSYACSLKDFQSSSLISSNK